MTAWPYMGPYKLLKKSTKIFKIAMQGRDVTVTIDLYLYIYIYWLTGIHFYSQDSASHDESLYWALGAHVKFVFYLD